MRSAGKALVVTALVWLAGPMLAMAAEDGGVATESVTSSVSFVAGIVALVVAVLLLLDVLALRRIAEGAAIADNIAYVMAGVACLAAAVLVGWIARFAPTGLSESYAQLGADLLIVAAMVLLGVYFYRVRHALLRYLDVFSGEELLARAQGSADAVPGTKAPGSGTDTGSGRTDEVQGDEGGRVG